MRSKTLTRPLRLLVSSWKPLALVCFLLYLESFYHTRPNRNALQHPLDEPFSLGCLDTSKFPSHRANATLMMLAKNSDIEGAKKAILSVEERFNYRAKYPYVLLNNDPFSAEFEDAIRSVASGNVTFAVLPKEMWGYPSNLDQVAAQRAMRKQEENGILYGALPNYHHMCRFTSGFFFDVEALQKYRWYWRIEPEVEFTCDITYDPFLEMQNHGKRYGYVIALWELYKTAPTLFRKISDYKKLHGIGTTRLWSKLVDNSRVPWPFRTIMRLFANRDSAGDAWNLCHFWSNFEIADMDWYRSREYRDLFKYLDQDGGFYMERWGDAPVHTFAAALLLSDQEIHHFQDWGYVHPPFQYIPTMPKDQLKSTPMRNLQSQSVSEWQTHSKVIGCNCQVDMDRAGILRPNCMNTIIEAFT